MPTPADLSMAAANPAPRAPLPDWSHPLNPAAWIERTAHTHRRQRRADAILFGWLGLSLAGCVVMIEASAHPAAVVPAGAWVALGLGLIAAIVGLWQVRSAFQGHNRLEAQRLALLEAQVELPPAVANNPRVQAYLAQLAPSQVPMLRGDVAHLVQLLRPVA